MSRFELGDRVAVNFNIVKCPGRLTHILVMGVYGSDRGHMVGRHDRSEVGMKGVVDQIEPDQETGHVVWMAVPAATGGFSWRDCFKPEELANLSRPEEE